jgi:hypothetical protein
VYVRVRVRVRSARLYESAVRPGDDEPEDSALQKLPAAVLQVGLAF